MYVCLSQRRGALEFRVFRQQCFFLFPAGPRRNRKHSLNDTWSLWLRCSGLCMARSEINKCCYVRVMIVIEVVLYTELETK